MVYEVLGLSANALGLHILILFSLSFLKLGAYFNRLGQRITFAFDLIDIQDFEA